MPDTFDPKQYLKDSVEIDDLVLDAEFIRVPADLAFWSARYADSVKVYLLAKLEKERVQGKVRLMLKAEAVIEKNKMTADDLEAAVANDPDYLDAAVVLIESDAEMKHAKGRVEAVAAKKDMVQSLGAKLRSEMERDPMIRQEHRNRN